MSLEKLGDGLVGFESTEELFRVILIDWDLCVRISDDPPSARRSQRTVRLSSSSALHSLALRASGAWQFISAELLPDPQRIQTIEDDRESAIHVLTWLALRYTKHDELVNLNTYLIIYDEVNRRKSKGILTRGSTKGNQFADELPTLIDDPLNRLLIVVKKNFLARYGETPDDEIQEAKDLVAKPNWLVEVLNKHLESDDRPA